MNTTPSADQSCEILAEMLLNGQPFVHSKWGDGAIMVMHEIPTPAANCDGEPLWKDLEAARRVLWDCWETLCRQSLDRPVFMGDWLTAGSTDGVEEQWRAMSCGKCCPHDFVFMHYEALLLHRLSPYLAQFYRALATLPAKKLYLSSWSHRPAAEMLGAELVLIPDPRAYQVRSDEIARRAADQILQAKPDILLISAGGVGVLAQQYCSEQLFTQIQIGSGLDPLCMGRTRSGQISTREAAELFRKAGFKL